MIYYSNNTYMEYYGNEFQKLPIGTPEEFQLELQKGSTLIKRFYSKKSLYWIIPLGLKKDEYSIMRGDEFFTITSEEYKALKQKYSTAAEIFDKVKDIKNKKGPLSTTLSRFLKGFFKFSTLILILITLLTYLFTTSNKYFGSDVKSNVEISELTEGQFAEMELVILDIFEIEIEITSKRGNKSTSKGNTYALAITKPDCENECTALDLFEKIFSNTTETTIVLLDKSIDTTKLVQNLNILDYFVASIDEDGSIDEEYLKSKITEEDLKLTKANISGEVQNLNQVEKLDTDVQIVDYYKELTKELDIVEPKVMINTKYQKANFNDVIKPTIFLGLATLISFSLIFVINYLRKNKIRLYYEL